MEGRECTKVEHTYLDLEPRQGTPLDPERMRLNRKARTKLDLAALYTPCWSKCQSEYQVHHVAQIVIFAVFSGFLHAAPHSPCCALLPMFLTPAGSELSHAVSRAETAVVLEPRRLQLKQARHSYCPA